MKRATGLIALLLTALISPGQEISTSISGSITPYPIGISYDKTTNLIFPYSIRSVDRGNSEVLVQKAKGVENLLQVKAGVHDFSETNLTVVTGEGALYSFLLQYHRSPRRLNLNVSEMGVPAAEIAILSDGHNEAVMHGLAERIATKKKMLSGPGDNSFEVAADLHGIYVHGDMLFFQLHLENESYINYDVDQFRIYLRDRKRSKRTATQEIEVMPVYVQGNIRRIEGRSGQTVVVAMDKFTIPDKKNFIIQLTEKNGGRHLEFRIKNRHLVKARQI